MVRLSHFCFVLLLIVGGMACSEDATNPPTMSAEEAGSDSGATEADSGTTEADSGTAESDASVDESLCFEVGCDYVWESLPDPISRNSSASLTRMSDGSLLLAGGIDDTQASVTTVERFDFTTGQWSQVTPMPVSSHFHSAVALSRNRLLIGGGVVSVSTGPNSSAITQQEEVLLYDGDTDTWERLTSDWSGFKPSYIRTVRGDQNFGEHVLAFQPDDGQWRIFDVDERSWTLITETEDPFDPSQPPSDPSSWNIPDTTHLVALPDGGYLTREQRYGEPAMLVRYDATFQKLDSINMPAVEEPVMAFVEAQNTVFMFGSQFVDETALAFAFDLETFTFEPQASIESDKWFTWTQTFVLEETLVLLLSDFRSPQQDALSIYNTVEDTWHVIDAPFTTTSYAPVTLDDGRSVFFNGRQAWILDTSP